MQPAMLATEIALFKSVLACTQDYVEFGSGGSTVMAHRSGCRSIVSIDSSSEWLGKVEQACVPNEKTTLKTVLVDIGPIKALGYPKDETCKDRWESYHLSPWLDPALADADTYLIDGRFRVACVLQTILRCSSSAVVMIHDFANRKHYQGVVPLLREIARADNLSVFLPKPDFSRAAARALLAKHALDPN
jgi:hypothetical protein